MNLCPEGAVEHGRRKVEEDSLGAHQSQLLIGRFIAMLDRVRACVDRDLDAHRADSVHRNFELLTVCFFDERRHFRGADVVSERDLDETGSNSPLKLMRLICACCGTITSSSMVWLSMRPGSRAALARSTTLGVAGASLCTR